MNYSSINEAFNIEINEINEINGINGINGINEINEINANNLIKDYRKLNDTLNIKIIKLKELEKYKEETFNYKCNIYLNHQNAMIKLHRETAENNEAVELNEYIIKYIELIKNYYDNWINEYYNPLKIKLQDEINDKELKLLAYRNLFIKTTNEIINTEKINKNICPICFENEINMCAIPCGHTCCNECVMQSYNFNNNLKKCMGCRNNIKEYIKIFFSL